MNDQEATGPPGQFLIADCNLPTYFFISYFQYQFQNLVRTLVHSLFNVEIMKLPKNWTLRVMGPRSCQRNSTHFNPLQPTTGQIARFRVTFLRIGTLRYLAMISRYFFF